MAEFDVIIVGGGISGLAALHYVRTRRPELSVRLYESDSRLGGTIGTDTIRGYSLDWGPNGFLDREPLTLQLCDELGLRDKLERANENVSNRFILRKGKLRSVPMSPPKFLSSDILSLKGKLRVMMEPFAKGLSRGIDESIYEFGKRRIGTEAADYLIQPMVSGVYGGVAAKMSLRACFPTMYEMESTYGSLTKAMIAKARQAKREKKKSGGPSGPGGWLTSFRGGLNRIIEAFEQQYRPFLTLGVGVREIKKVEAGFSLAMTDGQTISARQVIVATPSINAAGFVKTLSSALATALGKIAYAPIAVVCLGYKASAVKTPLNGFGFLVPSKENRRILGSIWTSSIFANRAPQGSVQFRSMIGGDGDHDSARLSDAELVKLTTQDLDKIVGLTAEPELIKIYRWEYGIPQYHIGHLDRMQTIERELKSIGNLYITGNAYYGIGLNDCVKQSYRVVNSLT